MIRILMLWFGWFLILVPTGLVAAAAVVLGFGLTEGEEMGAGGVAAVSATVFGFGIFYAAAPIVMGMILVALAKMMRPEPEHSRRRGRW